MSTPTAIDNSVRHARYVMRPQPGKDETDPDVLHDRIQELRTELSTVTGARRKVHARTETDPRVLHDQIEGLNEMLAEAYIKRAGVPAEAHTSECAVNQSPVYRPGPCDCGAVASSSARSPSPA